MEIGAMEARPRRYCDDLISNRHELKKVRADPLGPDVHKGGL
jgi:hypothetical protein